MSGSGVDADVVPAVPQRPSQLQLSAFGLASSASAAPALPPPPQSTTSQSSPLTLPQRPAHSVFVSPAAAPQPMPPSLSQASSRLSRRVVSVSPPPLPPGWLQSRVASLANAEQAQSAAPVGCSPSAAPSVDAVFASAGLSLSSSLSVSFSVSSIRAAALPSDNGAEQPLAAEQQSSEQSLAATQPSPSPQSTAEPQSPSSPSPSPSPYAALPSLFPSSSRVLVACELADTERSYVAALDALEVAFISPLRDALTERSRARPPLSSEQQSVVFSNVSLIHSLSRSFQSSISARLTQWLSLPEEAQLLGDVVAQFAPFFRLYSQYCATFDASQKMLQDLAAGGAAAAFSSFVSRALQHPACRQQSLASLLIQPIQRVPRYKLLLEQLVRQTPAQHPDLPLLTAALLQVSTVAQHINEAIRRRERAQEVVAIEQRFLSPPGFLHASRSFIRQGAVTQLASSGPRSDHFFLFNDLLASARSLMGKWRLKLRIPIDSTFALGERGAEAPAGPTAFSLLVFYSSCSCLSLFFSDAAEKAAWREDLEHCISQAANTIQAGEKEKEQRDKEKETERQTAAVSTAAAAAARDSRDKEKEEESKDTCVSSADRSCAVCSSVFTLFTRRQSCRQCLRSVCGDCSRSRLVLNSDDRRPERVCDACALSVDKATVPLPSPSASAFATQQSAQHCRSLSLRSPAQSHASHRRSSPSSASASISCGGHVDALGTEAAAAAAAVASFPSSPSLPSPSGCPYGAAAPTSPSAVPASPLSPLSSSSVSFPPLRQWDCATVLRWLCEAEVGFAEYADAFNRFHVDGCMLREMTDDELRLEIGMQAALHRKRMLRLIQKRSREDGEEQQTQTAAASSPSTSPSLPALSPRAQSLLPAATTPAMPKRAAPSLPQRQRNSAIVVPKQQQAQHSSSLASDPQPAVHHSQAPRAAAAGDQCDSLRASGLVSCSASSSPLSVAQRAAALEAAQRGS